MFHRKIRHADHVLMRRARFIQRLHLFQGWPLQEIAFFSYYMREYTVKKVRTHACGCGCGCVSRQKPPWAMCYARTLSET